MTSKARRHKLIAWAGLILGIGLAYALFVRLTGLALPCPFHLVTGLLCPGCGVTRMSLALLRLDFAAAWQANPALLLLLPALAWLLGQVALRYVKTGQARLSPGQNILVWAMVLTLLLYGIGRNLPALSRAG